MALSVYILDSAKDDYREIRKYVKQKFGEKIWQDSLQQYKEVLKNMAEYPSAGLVPDEAMQLGLQGIRERLVGQARVIYDVASHSLYVYMFVSTRRDFMTMLAERVLKSE